MWKHWLSCGSWHRSPSALVWFGCLVGTAQHLRQLSLGGDDPSPKTKTVTRCRDDKQCDCRDPVVRLDQITVCSTVVVPGQSRPTGSETTTETRPASSEPWQVILPGVGLVLLQGFGAIYIVADFEPAALGHTSQFFRRSKASDRRLVTSRSAG